MGATPDEAVSNLGEVRSLWIQGRLASGSTVPEPSVASSYSGKFVLRVPKGLHRLAEYRAHQEGVSLNSLITALLSGALGYPSQEARQSQEFGDHENTHASLYGQPLWTSQAWEIEASSNTAVNEEISGLILAIAKQIGNHNKSPYKLVDCENYYDENQVHVAAK
jgi:hypothetical protein